MVLQITFVTESQVSLICRLLDKALKKFHVIEAQVSFTMVQSLFDLASPWLFY